VIDVLVVLMCLRFGLDAYQSVLSVLGTSSPTVRSIWVHCDNEEWKFWHISQWNSRYICLYL